MSPVTDETMVRMHYVCRLVRTNVPDIEIIRLVVSLESALFHRSESVQSRYNSLAEMVLHFIAQGSFPAFEGCDVMYIRSLLSHHSEESLR